METQLTKPIEKIRESHLLIQGFDEYLLPSFQCLDRICQSIFCDCYRDFLLDYIQVRLRNIPVESFLLPFS
jgi:hypothetical protein